MTHWKAAALGFALVGSIASASAQGYGGSDGYRDRGYERDRGSDRERGSSDRDRGERSYGRDRQAGFDAREYLKCNPDVRRAIQAGQMKSAAAHYRTFGRRENRPLSC